jgi:hypothetical protein
MVKLFLFLLIFPLCYLSCRQGNSEIEITPIEGLTDIDSAQYGDRWNLYRDDFYLVENLNDRNIGELKTKVSEFVKANYKNLASKYYLYRMNFVKASDQLNLNVIKKDPGYVKRFIGYEKFLFIYSWINDKPYWIIDGNARKDEIYITDSLELSKLF